MGFWSGYWKSMKPREVEEPIDVWVHRPLAYVLARALLPTPVSANAVTFVSILFGLAACGALVLEFRWHLQLGGLLIFLSAVCDCADGQLARMRGTSSTFGRMLDGVADLIVAVAAVGGSMWVLYVKFPEPPWVRVSVLGAAAVTAVTGSFHTSTYDHEKNLYLKLTSKDYREGESFATALARFEEQSAKGLSLLRRFAWRIYLFYVGSQEDYARGFDPNASPNLDHYPPHDPRTAAIYARHAGPLMWWWRTWFGFGSLVFGIALFQALDAIEWYMLFRLVGLNGLFYGYMRPAQRRASRAAFAEMNLVFPSPPG